MQKVLFVFFLCVSLACPGFEITKDWVIICGAGEPEPVKFAASELSDYIFKTAGFRLKTAELKTAGTRAIIVKQGKYESEEWSITRLPDGDLVLTGGYPRGVLYGVYEFIEKVLGCRFLAKEAEYLPKLTKINVPDDIKIAGKPDFKFRFLQLGEGIWQTQSKFHVKHKLNGTPVIEEKEKLKYGYYERCGWKGGHNFYWFSKNFPEGKDEYFSMTADGKRLRAKNNSGPGQICTSHPELRKFVIEQYKKIIADDCGIMEKNGLPKSRRFFLCSNDNHEKCVCRNCLALEKKYGSYSGVMIEFLNEVTSELKKDYPDLTMHTYIYTFTEFPPEGIKPAAGVVPIVGQLGGEFMGNVCKRDSLRSLSHPNNKKALELLTKWSSISNELGIHDYWILYRQSFSVPFTNISAIPEILRLYKKLGVSYFLAETQVLPYYCNSNFSDLKIYLGGKLLTDVEQNEEIIIDEFMRLYYGPSSDAMKKQLAYLEKRMNEEPGNLGSVTSGNKKYLDKKFFEESERLFAEAEEKAGNDKTLLHRIGQERINYDFAALNLEKRLGLELDRKNVLKRLRENMEWVTMRYLRQADHKKYAKKLDEIMNGLALQVPVPEQFTKEKIYDFTWNKFVTRGKTVSIVSDSEAAGGRALCYKSDENVPDPHKRQLEYGVYSYIGKKDLLKATLPQGKTPEDEKYHWYKIGTTRLYEHTQIWAHWTWRLGQKVGDNVFDPLSPETQFDIWISLKLQGPAYSPGSQKENAIFLDRIIFVEHSS